MNISYTLLNVSDWDIWQDVVQFVIRIQFPAASGNSENEYSCGFLNVALSVKFNLCTKEVQKHLCRISMCDNFEHYD